MNSEPREPSGRAADASAGEQTLSFALNFISGRGLLTARDRRVGPLEVKLLELEIPNISFPFDVTGGAERFKARRCILRHLVFSLDGEGLARALSRAALVENGFPELKAVIRDGYVELAGRFRVGDHESDFSLRATPILRSPEELGVVFYDARMYGTLGMPVALVPVYLARALNLPFIDASRAGMWIVRPAEQFVRSALPQGGWKIPETRHAQLVAAEAARGRVTMVAGPEGDPTQKQIAEREPPEEAVLASEGVIALTNAERALARGALAEALHLFHDALEEGRGGRWARDRLLQLGAADPELAADTRQLAEDALAENPNDVQALIALAAVALRERSFGEASNRFGMLAELAHARKERADIIAAELAAAAAATPVDPAGALAAYERAAARARDSVVAHRALFELRAVVGDWAGAVQAGERLLRLLTQPETQAAVHRELGKIHRVHLRDFKQARAHFERALRLTPEDPDALEGLAETYAARGEPGRATAYLARLAEQAESSGDKARIVALNLRLGDIWERWLSDPETAAGRYYRVLDADPRNRPARLRLARLAEAKGELIRARAFYEDILATEESGGDPAALPDIVAAYTRLARVTFTASGPTAEAVACLERAVELDPTSRVARDELARLLRLRREWGRLVNVLVASAKGAAPDEARRLLIDAARIELDERRDQRAAEPHLLAALDSRADETEAVELLAPLLEARGDVEELARRLYAAAELTLEPELRARWLFRIARARASTPAAHQYLVSALEANPYLYEAAEALVAHTREHGNAEQRAIALGRLAVAAPQAAERSKALSEAAQILHRELGRPRDAEAMLQEAAAQSPADVETWLALAAVQEGNGQLTTARVALDKALTALGNNPSARAIVHTRLADLSRRTGDIESQAQHLLAAMANGADASELRPRLTQVLSSLGRKDQLADLLEGWAGNAGGDEADGLRLEAATLREATSQPRRAMELYRTVLLDRRTGALEAAKSLERLAIERNDSASIVQAVAYELELAPAEELKPLLARLVKAQVAAGDGFGAEASALKLLELDPRSALAHRTLAEHYEGTGAFGDALNHWLAVIYEANRDPKDRAGRRDSFERAAALALEIAGEHVGRLRDSFDREFPEAPPAAMSRTYGEVLAQQGKWPQLLALRRFQIEHAPHTARAEWRREVAEILHRRLGRSAEAVPFYQDIIAHQPEDAEARDALVSILDELGRDGDLASLLFALSQLVSDGRAALAYGIRSADVYAQKVADESSGVQVLRITCARADIDPDDRALHECLRRYGLDDEVSQLLERSIGAAPDPEDGRFAELIRLLTGPLGDTSRAAAWCERMIEAFPAADVPRQLYASLLTTQPQLGDAEAALRAWADARSGGPRAAVLGELAKLQLTAGDEETAVRTLVEAADADPANEVVLSQLIDRAMAAADFARALHWLERLATATEPGPHQDELWRRMVQIATDYAEDAAAVARALEGITRRSEDETRLLVDLLAERKLLDGLAGLAATAGGLPPDLALKAGAALADGRRVDEARIFLEQAMARGDKAAAWDVADRAWRAAGRLEELGRWRLQAARHLPAADATALKLLGYADMIEAGRPAAEAASPAMLDSLARDLDLTRPGAAWALFRAGRAVKQDAWLETAMRALAELLPESDPRLLEVMHVRIERELAARRFDAARKLVDRLLVIGDPAADEWMEVVLNESGRRDELLDYLLGRAESLGPGAAPVWMRIAAWYADAKQWPKAVGALGRVAPQARTLAWGELMCRVAAAVDDAAREAEGASVCAELAGTGAEQATWLRRAGRLLWWRLGDAERAKAMLRRAHALEPLTAASVRAEVVAAAGKPEATRLLAEALAVIDGAEGAPLWFLQAQLAAKARDKGESARALARALELASDDAALLAEIAQGAQRLGERETCLGALRRASAVDPALEEGYLKALESYGAWDEAAQVLETSSTRFAPADAAKRLEQAGDVALKQLDDAHRALDLYSRAVSRAPAPTSLTKAFALAVKLGRSDVAAAVGAPLLERMPPGASERPSALRAWVDALDAEGRATETRGPREELLQRRLATATDKLVLARLYAEDDPTRAAPLMEQAVLDPALEGEPALLVEAARLWASIDAPDRARTLLREALVRGADDLAAHALGVDLLAGDERITSLGRVVDAGADESWPAERRADARVELATARLAIGDAEGALELLQAALGLGKPAAWAQATERVLVALRRERDLAQLWVEETEGGSAPWSPADQRTRLDRAAAIFGKAGDAEQEMRALDALLRLDPTAEGPAARLSALAVEIGDEDRYVAMTQGRLARASGPLRAKVAAEAATHLLERFNDAAAAVDLIVPELETHPTLALALVLEQALAAAGRAEDARALLAQAAEHAPPQDRAALLARAAELASSEGLADEAYVLYRRALDDDPSVASARDYCLAHAESHGLWAEATTILERAAEATPDFRAELLARAAQMAREHLADDERELGLLRQALAAEPSAGDVAGRVAVLHLGRGELDMAMDVLLTGHVPGEEERELGPALVQAMTAAEREADAELVMEWFAARHADAHAAREYRLVLARKHGDAGAVLAELAMRLESAADMPPAEAAHLRVEAARAALQLGDEGGAASYLREVIRGSGDDVEPLFEAWSVVVAWGEADLQREAAEQAASVREEVFALAASAKGVERVRWLELLGCANESAGDEQGALGAFSQALVSDPSKPSPLAVASLERLHARRGDWLPLVALFEQLGAEAASPRDRAAGSFRAARLWREQLGDEAKAEAFLDKALAQDPGYEEAQLELGLLLWARQKYAKALPYLEAQVGGAMEPPVDHLVALADCVQHAMADLDRARDLVERCVELEPARADLQSRRAELLEATGALAEAEAAWLSYLELLGPGGAGEDREPVQRRLAAIATKRGDAAAAIDYLEQARRAAPESVDLMGQLRDLYERVGRWSEAAELRLREASLASDPASQAAHFNALAALYRDHLDDSIMAAAMLEKASELDPEDAGVAAELTRLYESTGNWAQYVLAAERLMRLDPDQQRVVPFLLRLSTAYEEAGDLLRAKELTDKALALEPDGAEIKARQRALAQATGDYRGFAAAEEAELAGEVPPEEKLQRLVSLAEVYTKHLSAPERAVSALERALALDSEDRGLTRRLADAYALEAATYGKATELYRGLLAEAPLDADLLRILARLSGQLGDTDRAYGYYAALLTLVSGDTEAQRFVEACRAARPVGPQRPLTDTDRAQGLVHPSQVSPVEDVFTPLARFAELTQPGDLVRRGVTDRDLLAAGEPRRDTLAKVLEPLGLPQAAVYVWRAGAFACELELVSPPAILVGAVLASDAPERQRAFLVARASELYRSGHALCERLPTSDLAGLVAALCMAVDARSTPPAATHDTQGWAQVTGAPMTPQIRSIMAPRIQGYLRASPEPDVAEWRRGCLSTAARTAMLVSCDVEEAVTALLRLRGFDDIDDDQRLALLREAPEELDLVRFAVSEQYFKLRQGLGLALRRSK